MLSRRALPAPRGPRHSGVIRNAVAIGSSDERQGDARCTTFVKRWPRCTRCTATDPNSFATIASFHGGPPIVYCSHGAPGFFTWHRAYLMAFENALRLVGCQVTLPYWDWSSGPTTGVPAACRLPTYVNRLGATVANPLFSGPRAGGGQTARRADIDTTAYDDLATSAQAAMTAATFSSFQNQVSGVHGSVHGRTGGDMGSVPTAATIRSSTCTMRSRPALGRLADRASGATARGGRRAFSSSRFRGRTASRGRPDPTPNRPTHSATATGGSASGFRRSSCGRSSSSSGPSHPPLGRIGQGRAQEPPHAA